MSDHNQNLVPLAPNSEVFTDSKGNLTTGPFASVSNEVFIAVHGSDITGNGSEGNPWASISYAYSQITTATASEPWAINAGPGGYSETNVLIKPNIFIVGLSLGNNAIVVSGSWSLDPSWATEVAGTYGFANASLVGTFSLDFSALTPGNSSNGIFVNTFNGNSLSFSARPGLTDQISIKSAFLQLGADIHGGQVLLFNTQALSSVSYDMGSLTGESGQFAAFGSQINASLSVTTSDPSNSVTVELLSSTTLFTQSFDGSGLSVYVDAISLCSKSNVTLTNSPSINRVNDAYDLAYAPTTPSDWSPPPAIVQDALDQLGATTATPPTIAEVLVSGNDAGGNSVVNLDEVSANYFTGSLGPASHTGVLRLATSQYIAWRDPTDTVDEYIQLQADNVFHLTTGLTLDSGNVRVAGNLGVGNSAAATTPGTVVKKIEIFDASGTSLGFIAVYDSIT